jgi:hypothetical protein
MFGVIELFAPGFYAFFKYLLKKFSNFLVFHNLDKEPLVSILKNKLQLSQFQCHTSIELRI